MHYMFGAYYLDTQRNELHRAGVLVPLRPRVFQVLAYLVAQHDRVVRKEELLEALWPGQFVGEVGLNTALVWRSARGCIRVSSWWAWEAAESRTSGGRSGKHPRLPPRCKGLRRRIPW